MSQGRRSAFPYRFPPEFKTQKFVLAWTPPLLLGIHESTSHEKTPLTAASKTMQPVLSKRATRAVHPAFLFTEQQGLQCCYCYCTARSRALHTAVPSAVQCSIFRGDRGWISRAGGRPVQRAVLLWAFLGGAVPLFWVLLGDGGPSGVAPGGGVDVRVGPYPSGCRRMG